MDILRTARGSGDWRTIKQENPDSGVRTATYTYFITDTVGILIGASNASIATGENGVYFYHAEKIMIRKKVGAGEAFLVGNHVFLDPADMLVSPNCETGRLKIGICVRNAGVNDVRVMIDLKGEYALDCTLF